MHSPGTRCRLQLGVSISASGPFPWCASVSLDFSKIRNNLHHLLEGQLEKCHQGDGKHGDLNIKALSSLTAECGILWSTPTQRSFHGKCTRTPVGSVAQLLPPGGVPSLGSHFSARGLELHSRLEQFSFSPTHKSLIGVPSYF